MRHEGTRRGGGLGKKDKQTASQVEAAGLGLCTNPLLEGRDVSAMILSEASREPKLLLITVRTGAGQNLARTGG